MRRASRNILYALALVGATALQASPSGASGASGAEICEAELPLYYSFKKKPEGLAQARVRKCPSLACEHEQDGIDYGMRCVNPQVLQEGSLKDGIEGNVFWAEFYSDLAPKWLGGLAEDQKCQSTLSKINELPKTQTLVRIVSQDIRGEMDEEHLYVYSGCSKFGQTFGSSCQELLKLVAAASKENHPAEIQACLAPSPDGLFE